jgi:hypothetical protein
MAQVPETTEIVGRVLAIAVEKEDPFDIGGQFYERGMQGSGLAVMRSGEHEDLGPSRRSQKRGLVTTAIIEDSHRKSGPAASVHDSTNGRRFVVGGNQDQRGSFCIGRLIE